MANIYIDGSGSLFEGQESKIAIVLENGIKKKSMIIFPFYRLTNNEVEYEALRDALQMANEDDTIFTDSQLLVGHMTKGWKLNAENLRKNYDYCMRMIEKKRIKLVWVPREKNIAGDLLEKK